MNPFRRTPKKPTPPAASLAAPRNEAEELADLQNVMGLLLDDMVVAQRVPPNAPAAEGSPPPAAAHTEAALAAPAHQPAATAPPAPPARAMPPAAPAAPVPVPGAPGAPNVGPQLLPAPDGSYTGRPTAPAAPPTPVAPAGAPVRNGQRPPMPPAPVGVSTVPPGPAAPLPPVQPAGRAAAQPAPQNAPRPPASGAPQPPGAPLPPPSPLPFGVPQSSGPHQPRTPGDPYALPTNLDINTVALRGRGQGVAIEFGPGAWEDMLDLLSYRLEQAGDALRSASIELELGNRPLTEADLDALRSVMAAYGMEPAVVRSSSERTFMAALALGIAAQQTTTDGLTVSEAERGLSADSSLGYFIFRGSLRSGQQLHRNEHVLIIGDVNPGAEVVSAGDILVWGRLRGIAHAGARGNSAAIIAALDLDPVQLRIDRVIGAALAGQNQNGPRWGGARSNVRRPELARLVAGRLEVQEWDETRGAGAGLKRRG